MVEKDDGANSLKLYVGLQGEDDGANSLELYVGLQGACMLGKQKGGWGRRVMNKCCSCSCHVVGMANLPLKR
jgi:hypothetical protein